VIVRKNIEAVTRARQIIFDPRDVILSLPRDGFEHAVESVFAKWLKQRAQGHQKSPRI
jgi:hypothetical protein